MRSQQKKKDKGVGKTRCSSTAHKFTQPGCGTRNWRYQAVWRAERSGDRYYTICEIYLDKFDQLTNWTECAEHTPIGNDLEDLQSELVRMYVDAACWKPVAFADLRVGMKFERAVTQKQRAAIADMFDMLGALTALPQTEPVNLGSAPNTESSPNNNVSPTPAGKGEQG